MRAELKSKYNVSINEHQEKVLVAHLQHVLQWNEKVNLTAIANVDTATVLHLEDSLSAMKYVERAEPGVLMDIGSGGGFPGIPLAVVSGRETTLVEAREKKVKILNEFIERFGLSNQIKALSSRAEELAQIEKGKYSVVTARALSSLPSIMELASPLMKKNGTLIAYKGNPEKEELKSAESLKDILGLEIEEVERIILSDKASKRTLVILRKTNEPQIQLPRRSGMAQKKPLA